MQINCKKRNIGKSQQVARTARRHETSGGNANAKMQMSLASEYQLPGRQAVCPPSDSMSVCLSRLQSVALFPVPQIATFFMARAGPDLTAAWPQYLY